MSTLQVGAYFRYGRVAGAREAPDRQSDSYRYNDYPPAQQQHHHEKHSAYSANAGSAQAADLNQTSWGGAVPAVQPDAHNSEYAAHGQHESNHYQVCLFPPPLAALLLRGSFRNMCRSWLSLSRQVKRLSGFHHGVFTLSTTANCSMYDIH